MRIITRSLLLFALLALMACATPRRQMNCATVRCAGCPEGQTHAGKPPSCCKCVPIDTKITDCSNVRCTACPPEQTPSLQPPDCCKCVATQ